MFVHISPELDAVGETLSTLKFVERVAIVELGAARVALARKEGEHEHRTNMNLQGRDPFTEPKSRRKPARDIGSNEASKKYRSRQKTQSIDLDELLGNSPPWPPISSPGPQKHLVLKVMPHVIPGSHTCNCSCESNLSNPLPSEDLINGAHGTPGSWEAENSRLSDSLYQKYLPEQSYNMCPGGNGFDVSTTDDLDELD
ncbi:kinesin-like protein KIN-14I isoform X1 [Tanacetum coccineum]